MNLINTIWRWRSGRQRKSRVRNWFYTGLALVLWLNCGKEAPQLGIVARYQSITISDYEFRESYFDRLMISNRIDSDTLRIRYVISMLQEKILAERAEAAGLKPQSQNRPHYQSEKNRRLIEALFQTEIAAHCSLPDSTELRQAWVDSQSEWKVWQLFSKDKVQIDSAYQWLKPGLDPSAVSVGQVAYHELGWIRWGDLEPHLEEAVIQTEPGQYSSPIHSLFGWHILGVINRKQNLMLTENDYLQHRSKFQKRMQRRTQEKAANDYIIQHLYSRSVTIHRSAFEQWQSRIDPIHPRPVESNSDKSGSIDTSLILADLGDFSLSLNEMMIHWPDIPESIRQQGPTACIHYAVRDQFLVEQAIKKGLDHHPWVQQMLKMDRIRELNIQYRRHLRQSIRLSNQTLQPFEHRPPGEDSAHSADQIMLEQAIEDTLHLYFDSTQIRIDTPRLVNLSLNRSL